MCYYVFYILLLLILSRYYVILLLGRKMILLNYMTVKEASVIWHMDISTIGKLLRAGKIEGSTRLGGHWVIPADAPKPNGSRRKGADNPPDKAFFLLPMIMISSSLCLMFPYLTRRGSLLFFISFFNSFMSMPLFYFFSSKK